MAGFLDNAQRDTAEGRMKGMGMEAPGDDTLGPEPVPADPAALAAQIADLSMQLADALAPAEPMSEPMPEPPAAGAPMM